MTEEERKEVKELQRQEAVARGLPEDASIREINYHDLEEDRKKKEAEEAKKAEQNKPDSNKTE